MTDFVGKTRYSINSQLWGAPSRKGEAYDIPENAYPYKEMTFVRKGGDGFVNKDTLKIALGHAWTEEHVSKTKYGLPDKSVPPKLTNEMKPYRLFYGQPLQFEGCGTSSADGTMFPGFLKNAMDPEFEELDNIPLLLFECVYIESLAVGVSGLPYFSPAERKSETFESGKIARLDDWVAFIKLGLTSAEGNFHPIVENAETYETIPGAFSDHVYKTAEPFSQHEMCSKQDFGKAAQVSIKTYYNTALDTKKGAYTYGGSAAAPRGRAWESFAANLGVEQYWGGADVFGYGKTHMFYNNALPTPYGLLRVMLNKLEVKDLYHSSTFTPSKELPARWDGMAFDIGNVSSDARRTFVKYPYELLMTLFGRVSPEKISRIANVHPKTEDAQHLFEDYFSDYMRAFSPDQTSDENELVELRQAVQLIDQVFDNVAISPSVLKNLDKVHQIKKYFPYYVETEFSTTTYTELGDTIKQMLFGKYFVNKIAGYSTYFSPTTLPSAEHAKPIGKPDDMDFYDYREEKHYVDKFGAGKPPKAVMNLGEFEQVNKKYYSIPYDINRFANDWTSAESYDVPDGKDKLDIQNHIAYLKDDVSEPIDVGEFNTIWKKVLGTALNHKLVKTYKKHFRSYEDLLKGKPAYSENVAYKIEKYAKKPGEGDEKYTLSQNFILPNTSDVNLFSYIDTQLKYGTDMIYKYKVYAVKIVFGCEYQYFWPSDGTAGVSHAGYGTAGPPTSATALAAATVEHGPAAPGDLINISKTEWHKVIDKEGGAKGWTAQMGVRIFPSIVMLEDMFYESPEIIISDHPPVRPDVNIVPYRAKSDKILILLNGMVDTYREEPIEMLPTDKEKFDFIKTAQMTSDNKIKFASDDAVKSYEIFRTKNKPLSYTDFELYRTIGETHYVDNIKPNEKYYYTFRALDGHGNISNPTEVYEVELIDDHGSVKPMIRVYNFEQPKYFEAIKECQKYLMIRPNLKQLYYNPDKDEIDHMFNNSAEAGLKRRFKLRITSKSTGKKIDLNINFSKKEVEE